MPGADGEGRVPESETTQDIRPAGNGSEVHVSLDRLANSHGYTIRNAMLLFLYENVELR